MVVVFCSLSLFFFLFFLVTMYYSFFSNFNRSVTFFSVRSYISSFECGFLGRGVAESSFSFTYFVLLVFFIIFDLEVSLLLNLPFQSFLCENYFYYLFFVSCLSLGYSLEVLKGYVSWGY